MRPLKSVAVYMVLLLAATLIHTDSAAAVRASNSPAAAFDCEATHVVGVHGMNEQPLKGNNYMGPLVSRFYGKLSSSAPQAYVPHGLAYPQVVLGDLTNFDPTSERQIANRVTQAQASLDTLIRTIVAQNAQNGCLSGQGDIVLVGYSLGAWIVDRFVQTYPKDASSLEAIILFGDPQYRSCDSVVRTTDCISTEGVGSVMSDPKGNLLKTQGIGRTLIAKGLALKADVPHYLPIPNPKEQGEMWGADALWRHTRSYCLRGTDANGGAPYYDPICAWNGPASLKFLSSHSVGYYAIKNSPLARAVSFVNSVLESE